MYCVILSLNKENKEWNIFNIVITIYIIPHLHTLFYIQYDVIQSINRIQTGYPVHDHYIEHGQVIQSYCLSCY